ncbi:MAG: selenide, water dikinase SelD [Gemmataceae bacterium]|nr:selenide, water dikinase SelD [Gemmataceae bacterium]
MNGQPVMLQKSVVLVGAGNAHLVFIRRWRMQPLAEVAVTLVNAQELIPYSAMTPACLNGEATRPAISIDLVRLCRSAGIRLVVGQVARVDIAERQVHFTDRPPLTFDVLSLNVGAVAQALIDPQQWEWSIPLRPLSHLLDRCFSLFEELRLQPRPFHLVVVGGGASGCELTAALARRGSDHPGFRLTLIEANERLLPRFPHYAAQVFTRQLQGHGVAVLTGRRVTGGSPGTLQLHDGTKLTCDAVIWATPGVAHPLLRASGLPTDPDGFLRVETTLQAEGIPYLFAAGDCVSFAAYPDLPHNGVYAVRQGPVLQANVRAFLTGQPLRPFRPQRRCLYLLNLSDGRAVGNYGRLAFSGRWVRRWKQRIDQRWLSSFDPPVSSMSTADGTTEGKDETPLMRCGGCGAKVPGQVLQRVLTQLAVPTDPRVVLGLQAGEDAAVMQLTPNGPWEVFTVDYFRAFCDDPYLLGQAAALHALSDLYAMNATPLAALAIVTLPFARGPIQEQLLRELLGGAQTVLCNEQVVLAGGHTSEGPELAIGFALTGLAGPQRLFRKNALQPGQMLVLTKPLGTGALWAAWMRAALPAAWWRSLISHLLQSNRAAARLADQTGLQACTDVTGFGLAGHLLEMLDASRLSARLWSHRVPRLPGFDELAQQGILSTLHADNARWEYRIHSSAPLPAWLFDPQTCGGLLLGVPREHANQFVSSLHQAGYHRAAIIGETIPLQSTIPSIEII